MRVVILTGNQLRHRFVASKLAAQLHVVGIVSEAKSIEAISPTVESWASNDQLVIDRHLAERDETEQRLFGNVTTFPEVPILSIPNKEINSATVFQWIRERVPDTVILYGTSIIRLPLLDHFRDRIINIHLGLSPYYRGSGTNFWPLVHGEPECVGATIHLAIQKVDAGAILHQLRSSCTSADRAHAIGTKTIVAAAEQVPKVLKLYVDKKIRPQSQNLSSGCVYRLRDFNATAVRTMWGNFDGGMMDEYLAHREERCAKFPIVGVL